MVDNDNGRIRRRILKIIIIFFFFSSVFILTLDYLIRQNPLWMKREPEAFEILNGNAVWRYMEEGKDPSVGKVWTTLNYDASFWKAGYGSFGTDTDFNVRNLLERESGEKNDVHSYFFRHEFEIGEEQVERVNSIIGEIAYKDAVVVYLNGSIIFTGNIPEGGFETNLEAGSSEERDEICNRKFQVTELSSLKVGRNVLSVEIHQSHDEESDIYFAFPTFSLSEENITEPDYVMKHLILTKSGKDDELYVNYVSGVEEAYRVEYMEADYYTGEEAFARHGDTEYMGSRYLENSYLSRVKLKRLKENMDYVYRIIRVGGKEATEVFRFSTGKNYKAVFGIAASPDANGISGRKEEWSIKADAGSINFLAVIGSRSSGGEQVKANSRMILGKSSLWREIPVIYTDAYSYQDETLMGQIFGTDNFYLSERDIAVIVLQDTNEADAVEFIQQVQRKTKHKWVVLLKADLDETKTYFDVGTNVVAQRTKEGDILVSYRENGEVHSVNAKYVEIAGYENQLEVKYYDDKENLLGHIIRK